MKKVFIIFIVIINFIYFNKIYANTNKNTIKYLIEFVNTKTNDLDKIINKYNLKEDKKLIKYLDNYKNINFFLYKIKNSNKIEDKKKYINNIVKKLKSLNKEIKIYLKNKLEEKQLKIKKISILYSKKLQTLIKKTNYIITQIALNLKNKENYTQKDIKIINLLYLIKLTLANLENLEQKKFYSRKELNNYILKNIYDIKKYFNDIKKLHKN